MLPIFIPLQGLLGLPDKELGDPGGVWSRAVCIPAQISVVVPSVKKDVRDTQPVHPPSQSSTHGEEASEHLGQALGEDGASSSWSSKRFHWLCHPVSSLFTVTRNRDKDLKYNLLVSWLLFSWALSTLAFNSVKLSDILKLSSDSNSIYQIEEVLNRESDTLSDFLPNLLGNHYDSLSYQQPKGRGKRMFAFLSVVLSYSGTMRDSTTPWSGVVLLHVNAHFIISECGRGFL